MDLSLKIALYPNYSRRGLGLSRSLAEPSAMDIVSPENTQGTSTGMSQGDLGQEWEGLVASRFRLVQKTLKSMVTDNGSVNEALLTELGWNLTREQFDGLLKGRIPRRRM